MPKNLNPIWDERLLFPGTLADFLEEGLTIKVRDKDTVGYDDPLGEVQVRLGALGVPHLPPHVTELSPLHQVCPGAVDVPQLPPHGT